MERFGDDMDGWYAHLHDDIVMEFPCGACVGMPTRIEGRAACAAVFQTVCDAVQVQFSNIRISPMADPNRLVAEYTGYSEPGGPIYNQTYISVQEYREGKMILFRDYWNAVVVRATRSEEHKSELQSLMRISYAVCCLTKNHTTN